MHPEKAFGVERFIMSDYRNEYPIEN